MSVFKDEAIVLKIEKIRDKELLYTLFTKTYGKIRANKKYSKTEKSIDLWNMINFEIITKENVKIHKIKNIKIKSSFNKERNKNFSEINMYMMILAQINKNIPDWLAFVEIFEIIEKINLYEKIDEIKMLLWYLKIKNVLWDLDINSENIIIKKILKFISNSKIDEILKLTWINENLKKELDSYV